MIIRKTGGATQTSALLCACAATLGLYAASAGAVDPAPADPHAGHTMPAMPSASLQDHMQMQSPVTGNAMSMPGQAYTLPTVTLLREDGSSAPFPKEVQRAEPVIAGFIFTTCTAICPITSQILAQVQTKLTAANKPFKIMSFSIDPDYDSPARMKAYAAAFHAGPNWSHYTGKMRDIVAVQKAFQAYRGDKMNHELLIFVRSSVDGTWTRIGGNNVIPTPEAVLKAYDASVAPASAAPAAGK
jgi:protein SCO1/2